MLRYTQCASNGRYLFMLQGAKAYLFDQETGIRVSKEKAFFHAHWADEQKRFKVAFVPKANHFLLIDNAGSIHTLTMEKFTVQETSSTGASALFDRQQKFKKELFQQEEEPAKGI